MEVNAKLIDLKDSVVAVVEKISKGEEVLWFNKSNEIEKIIAESEIPIYHKIAIKNIKKGEKVLKYGEPIGIAIDDIYIGEHVHVHNVKSN